MRGTGGLAARPRGDRDLEVPKPGYERAAECAAAGQGWPGLPRGLQTQGPSWPRSSPAVKPRLSLVLPGGNCRATAGLVPSVFPSPSLPHSRGKSVRAWPGAPGCFPLAPIPSGQAKSEGAGARRRVGGLSPGPRDPEHASPELRVGDRWVLPPRLGVTPALAWALASNASKGTGPGPLPGPGSNKRGLSTLPKPGAQAAPVQHQSMGKWLVPLLRGPCSPGV